MKRRLFFAAAFAVFSTVLLCFGYHFRYVEQLQMFLWDKGYLLSNLGVPAGFSAITSDLIAQSYGIPVLGPVLMSALLVIMVILTANILRKSRGDDSFLILSLLPAFLALTDVLDINFSHSGTVAQTLMLSAMALVVSIKNGEKRFIATLVSTAVVFWLGGPAAMVFALCMFLLELAWNIQGAIKYLVPVILVPVFAWISYSAGLVPDIRQTLLPGFFFHYLDKIPAIHYLSWMSVPVVMALNAVFRGEKRDRTPAANTMVLQSCLVVIAAVLPLVSQNKALNVFKAADTMARNKDWEKIKELYRKNQESTSPALINIVNLALAETGSLGEALFRYSQFSVDGILPNKKLDMASTSVGSDLYWSMGMAGLSQRMAFEEDMYAYGIHNPRAIQRLVQTNLVYGAYDVAQKYLNLLERCPAYRGWAKRQSRFLYDDEAVEADEELSGIRRCLPDTTSLGEIFGLGMDLRNIIHLNPRRRQGIQYLEALFLLDKDMNSMLAMLDEFYRTEALPSLPTPLQEAVVLVANGNGMSELTSRYGVDYSVKKRFYAFTKALNTGNGLQDFADTFWYYAFITNPKDNDDE